MKSFLFKTVFTSVFFVAAIPSSYAYYIGYDWKRVCTNEFNDRCSFESIYVVSAQDVKSAVGDLDNRVRKLESAQLVDQLFERIEQLEKKIEALEVKQ